MGINQKIWQIAFLLLLLGSMTGCYTFKGISIPPAVKTFAVRNLQAQAQNAPPTLALDLGERIKDKIRTETRMQLNNDDPDVEFIGKITSFTVIPVAPKPGEFVSLNQLYITIELEAVNNLEEEVQWPEKKEFRHFAEFSNTADLLSVQDELIRQISNQLLEDIFNHFFNNW